MTSKEFVKQFAEKVEVTQASAETYYNTMLDMITKEVTKNGEFNLKGIGCISTKPVPARTCRNPQTGAPVDKAATKKVMFKASATLKNAIRA